MLESQRWDCQVSYVSFILIKMLGSFICVWLSALEFWKGGHTILHYYAVTRPALQISVQPGSLRLQGSEMLITCDKVAVKIRWTCAGIRIAALPFIASTYAWDSYKPVSGSILVSITVDKNAWGYGFWKSITPWIISSGYVPPVLTNTSLVTLWCLSGILF